MTTLDKLLEERIAAEVTRRANELQRPIFVHQRSVEAVTGQPGDDFLEAARTGAFPSSKRKRLVFAARQRAAARAARRHTADERSPSNDAARAVPMLAMSLPS